MTWARRSTSQEGTLRYPRELRKLKQNSFAPYHKILTSECPSVNMIIREAYKFRSSFIIVNAKFIVSCVIVKQFVSNSGVLFACVTRTASTRLSRRASTASLT